MLTIKQFTYNDEVKYILQVGKNKIEPDKEKGLK
jgi:hypothetical protein